MEGVGVRGSFKILGIQGGASAHIGRGSLLAECTSICCSCS
jgi:hypothetical protein